MNREQLLVSLVAINPNGLHNTSTYLLKSYVCADERIAQYVTINLLFFDALIPPQSNALDFYLRKIIQSNGEVIGFSCYCWNIEIVLWLAKAIKKVRPKSTIILGGPEASGRYQELLESHQYIDLILVGEGEIGFRDYLLYRCFRQPKLQCIHNLSYRKKNQIVVNETAILESLDDIPPLFSSGFVDPNAIGSYLYSFETKRGCEYNCTYCLHHKGSHQIREYSLEYVLGELDQLLKSNLKYIWIIDPCFNQNETRSIQILEYIDLHNKQQIEFGFEIRNETMTENFIRIISRMKWIRFLAIGLQTLSIPALDSVNRIFSKKKFEDNIRLLKNCAKNLTVHIDLIFGLPMDTYSGYKRSIDYVLDLDCEVFTQPLKVLPGSELEINSNKFGLVYHSSPPYEVLCNYTYSYEEMEMTKRINAVLNLYQCHPSIKGLFRQMQKKTGKAYTELFEIIGSYWWEKGFDIVFQNFYRMKVNDIYTAVRIAAQKLQIVVLDDNSYAHDETYIQIDWGSIAPQKDYSLQEKGEI